MADIRLECLIVADDLTGACDAAVPFARHGLRAEAWLDPIPPVACDAAVVALSTDSRDLPEKAARDCIQEIAPRLPLSRSRILFKKIDSMLRGNPGAEIAAALSAFTCDVAVITPAFPAMGRTVESGRLHIAGSDSSPLDVASRLRAQGLEGVRFLVVDAATDDELDSAVAQCLQWQERILWAGSAGLAAALARAIGPESGPARRTPPAIERGPVLFALGSEHPVTVEQQRRLLAARPSRLISAESATAECLLAALAQGEHVILRVLRERTLAALVRDALVAARGCVAATVLSGGDTASTVCRALGVQSIQLVDEIAAGIPRGFCIGGVLDGAPVVTKSGAFGGPDALIEIADTLKCPNR